MSKEDTFTHEYFERAGVAVSSIEMAMIGKRQLAVLVEGLSVRAPAVDGGEFLITVRGTDHEGLPVVAFHSSVSLVDALTGVDARLSNGTFKWREDEYRR